MTTPHDLYIRFLATKGIDDLSEMNSQLAMIPLPATSQEELDVQWGLIHSSAPKNVIDQMYRKLYEPDFTRCLQVLEVLDLWAEFSDSQMKSCLKLVYDIHQDISLKVTLNALLIKRISATEIVRMLSTKFSTMLNEKQVDLYTRFFFDPRRMTRRAWKEYLKRCNGRAQKLYFTALTESEDVLKTELDLPSIINVSESIQWLLTKSFLKARSFMDIGTPDANREAREWSDQVVKLADKYEKYRSGDQNDFAKVLQMEFDFIDEPFETPDDSTYREAMAKQEPKK